MKWGGKKIGKSLPKKKGEIWEEKEASWQSDLGECCRRVNN